MINLTTETFSQEVEQSNLPVLLDFYADWCGPCKSVAPILEQLQTEFADKVKFFKVNIDTDFDLAQAFSVRGIPTFVILHDGQQDTKVGVQSADTLRNWIAEKLPA